jgi:hypothetical protein
LSLRHQLLASFGLQGVGAAAVLLSTLWLGASLGPEVQGGFSNVKSEIEFVAAFAMFGLPQALFFHVKSAQLSGRAALRWAWGCAWLALVIGAVYAAAQHSLLPPMGLVAVSLAVAACVLHGQLRALLLVQARSTWFNVLTALPQLLLLVGVAWAVFGVQRGVLQAESGAYQWSLLFAMAYGVAALMAWWRLTIGETKQNTCQLTTSSVGWPELGRYGLATWLTAALSTAAVWAAQYGVETTAGRVALGQFTMAMTLAQVPLTPISYAAPLLFRRWIDQPGERASKYWARVLFQLLLLLAALVWVASRWCPDLLLGAAYTGAAQALAVLLVGGAAEAASRVLTVQASARGKPWVGVQAELARWSVLAVGWLLPLSLLTWCAVWSAAASAAALVFAVHARSISD